MTRLSDSQRVGGSQTSIRANLTGPDRDNLHTLADENVLKVGTYWHLCICGCNRVTVYHAVTV